VLEIPGFSGWGLVARANLLGRPLRESCNYFRVGLVFKAHRRLYHSTLGVIVIKNLGVIRAPIDDVRERVVTTEPHRRAFRCALKRYSKVNSPKKYVQSCRSRSQIRTGINEEPWGNQGPNRRCPGASCTPTKITTHLDHTSNHTGVPRS